MHKFYAIPIKIPDFIWGYGDKIILKFTKENKAWKIKAKNSPYQTLRQQKPSARNSITSVQEQID